MSQKHLQDLTPIAPDERSNNQKHTGISERAVETFNIYPEFYKYFTMCAQNKFNKETNPKGIIPFGLAENKVAIDLLQNKLQEIAQQPENKKVYSYGLMTGEVDFRQALKNFIERKFHPLEQLDVDSIFVTDGVTVVLENLAFAIAEPGDYIIVFCPYYYRLKLDFYERPKVKVLPVQQSKTSDGHYAVDFDILENTMITAKKEGKTVRAIHVTNPNNPSGDVYSPQQLRQILMFAHRHNLHVIANELYGLSIFDPDTTFTSLLSLPHPDPEMVHFTWGFSKDFGLSGFRTSMLYTRNPGISQYFTQTSIYIRPQGAMQEKLKLLMEDKEFTDKEFFPTMKKKMLARYKTVKDAIEGCGGRVHPGTATIFRWLDLSSFLPTNDWEGEHQLFLRLFTEGVHVVAGNSHGSTEPGWFRMVAAMDDDVHEEGLKRLVAALKSIQDEKQRSRE